MKSLTWSFLVVSLLFTGCSDEKGVASSQPKMAQMPPLPVKAQVVKYEKVDFTKNYSAILKPFKEVEIVARINGILEKENFIEGSEVKKGDIIYEIQKEEYKAALDEAKATLSKAEANFSKASKDWSRAEYLFKNSAISEQQRDALLYAYDDAKAEVQQAKAAVVDAELKHSYTSIKAPISGIVGISSGDEGTYINVDSSSANLTTITSLDIVYAEFSVPSSDVYRYSSQIKNYAPVSLKVGSKTHNGRVDYVAPKLDMQTDTLLLRAVFKNPNRELVVGSYAEIGMDGFSYENVVKIPQNALIKTPEAVMVYVAKDGGISMRPVEVLQVMDGTALVSKGLSEGEKVVVSNIAKLRPNSKVSIMDGN